MTAKISTVLLFKFIPNKRRHNMSDEIKRHERYKKYAMDAYDLKNAKLPSTVNLHGYSENTKTGFYGYVLKEKDRVVIIYRGTDKKISVDLKSDANMAFRNKIPEQVRDALNLYDEVKATFPNSKIDIVGHSLGGSLAQYVAIMRNVNEAVCFAPVGIRKSVDSFINKYGSKTSQQRIINYNNPKDVLTTQYRYRLYGTNYSIGITKQKGDTHRLEDMAPLSTRKKVNQTYKINQNSSITGCAGTYKVSGYTREDGTKIAGYTRTCGAKHAGKEKYANKRFQDLSSAELLDAISYFV